MYHDVGWSLNILFQPRPQRYSCPHSSSVYWAAELRDSAAQLQETLHQEWDGQEEARLEKEQYSEQLVIYMY